MSEFKQLKLNVPKKLYKLSKKCFFEKTLLESFGLIKEQNMGDLSKNIARKKNIDVYSTMSETKAAFAERAIQSLKHIIYRYIEDHGEKFIHKLPQFVSTMNCRVN